MRLPRSVLIVFILSLLAAFAIYMRRGLSVETPFFKFATEQSCDPLGAGQGKSD